MQYHDAGISHFISSVQCFEGSVCSGLWTNFGDVIVSVFQRLLSELS